jgi:broad-specificity NMP kinase
MQKRILLNGTSSCGKTTLSKYFINYGFYHIENDEFQSNNRLLGDSKYILSTVDTNKYYTKRELDNLINKKRQLLIFKESLQYDIIKYEYLVHLLMYEESLKHEYVIYDDICQNILKHNENENDIFIIIMYTPLKQLINNIFTRRTTTMRGLSVFNQYTERYVKTTEYDENIIDNINKPNFIKHLKHTLKFMFDSEENLILFANDIFTNMEINDDEIHPIKLRDTFRCDLLINTTHKTINEIFEEIKHILNLNTI